MYYGPYLEEVRQRAAKLPNYARELIAGAVTGVIGKSSVAPLERVKILFQTGRMPGSGVFDTLSLLAKKEGFLGWYRGNGASVLRIIPYSALHFHAYEFNRRLLLEHPLVQKVTGSTFNSKSNVVDLFAGAGAGAAAVAFTYPLDLARTRLACLSEVHGTGSQQWRWHGKLGLHYVLADVIRQNGIWGLYRGIGPTMMGILPYAGLKFYVYQKLKRRYHQFHSEKTLGGDAMTTRLPILVMLTFGGIAGLVGQTAAYPLDVVRRRMQVPQHSSGFIQSSKSDGTARVDMVYRSTWDGLVKIARTGGFRSLFAGLSINYMKVIPSTAIGFTVYDTMKDFLHLKGHLV